MRFGIIYKVENLENGKVYIGQTLKTLSKRKSQHYTWSQYGKYYFHNALRANPKEVFEWTILANNIPESDLDDIERFYIKYYNSFLLGYNQTSGGGGKKDRSSSPETRLKISKSLMGKHPTQETRKKLSVAAKARCNEKFRIESSKRFKGHEYNALKWEIIFPDKSTQIIKNLRKFCRNHSLNYTAMWAISKKKQKQHKNFKCRKI